ncbi:MAG: mechanosensitive ion channel family protein [Nanobdellota archaeon]
MVDLVALWENPVIKKVVYILIVVVLTFVAGRFMNRALKRVYDHNTKAHVVDKTKFKMLRRFIVGAIYIIGILLIMSSFPALKEISYSIFAGAGVLAIVVGFATQEVFSNIVAGIFISIFEPFRIDDRIKVADVEGYVEDITSWHTVVRTFNNERLMIPNSIIAKEKLENSSIMDKKVLNFIDFGISYDSDIDKARKIISQEVKKTDYWVDNRKHHQLLKKEEPFKVRVIFHGDFSIGLRLYVWTEDASAGYLLKCQLLENVKKRFDKEGVEIPFPYRTIVQKGKKA